MREIAAQRLAAEIRGRGTALTTGIVGMQFCFDVLAEAGFTDLVYSLLLKTGISVLGIHDSPRRYHIMGRLERRL